MIPFLIYVALLLPAPQKECRIVKLIPNVFSTVPIRLEDDWEDCKAAYVDVDTFAFPGEIIWIESHEKIKGKWGKPKIEEPPVYVNYPWDGDFHKT